MSAINNKTEPKAAVTTAEAPPVRRQRGRPKGTQNKPKINQAVSEKKPSVTRKTRGSTKTTVKSMIPRLYLSLYFFS